MPDRVILQYVMKILTAHPYAYVAYALMRTSRSEMDKTLSFRLGVPSRLCLGKVHLCVGDLTLGIITYGVTWPFEDLDLFSIPDYYGSSQ
jgi:hypothetical protein